MRVSRAQKLRIRAKYPLKQSLLQCNPQNSLDGGWGVGDGGGGGLHVFCELLAFWSAGAWGQRCCHDFLIAGLRMAVHSIGLGAWIRSQLSLTENDHY